MKNIVLKTDLGQKYTYDKYNGKFLGESDYDQVIRVQENTAIYKPNMRVESTNLLHTSLLMLMMIMMR